MHRQILLTTLASILLIATACGKKSRSQGANVSVNPSSPPVIPADSSRSIHGNISTITGPWFQFTVSFDNQSDGIITVINTQLSITGNDATAAPSVQSFDGSLSNYTYTVGNNSIACNYPSLGVFPINNQASSPTVDDNLYLLANGDTLTNLPANKCDTGTAVFYAQSLPTTQGGGLQQYQAQLKLVGWFGSYDKPEQGFSRVIYFSPASSY